VDAFVNTIGTFFRAKVPATVCTGAPNTGLAQQAEDTPLVDIKEHFELNTVHNIHLTNLMANKVKRQSAAGFGQILICLATLAVKPAANYALQAATKGGYKLYVDALRCELQPEGVRVMTIHPPSVNTNIFKKHGDKRDVRKYEDPVEIAKAIKFMLDQTGKLAIHELLIEPGPAP
jgi:short-subunit dehydrogenase